MKSTELSRGFVSIKGTSLGVVPVGARVPRLQRGTRQNSAGDLCSPSVPVGGELVRGEARGLTDHLGWEVEPGSR